MSKYLIILVIVLVISGLAYFSWSYISSFLSQKPAQQSIVGNLPPSVQRTEELKNGRTEERKNMKALSDGPVLDYWGNGFITTDGRTEGLENPDAEVGAGGKTPTQGSGQAEALNNPDEFYRLVSNPNTSKIIVASGHASSRTWKVFDPESAVSTALPVGIESATWSPDGKKIAYINKNGDIFIKEGSPSTSSGNREVKIINLNQIDSDIYWLRPDFLEIISKPTNYAVSTWLSLNLKTKDMRVMRDGVAGLVLNWSAENKLGLEFNAQNFSGALNIINEKGDALQTLSFLTMPQKCAWEKDFLYCAIPRDLKPRMQWVEEYLQQGFHSADDIFKFSLKTGEVSQVWSKEEGAVDVWHLETRDNALFFVNRYDSKLYELDL